jgi:probable HAF family extracellular repeat protein
MNPLKSSLPAVLALLVLVFPLGVHAQNATPTAANDWTLTALGTFGGENSSAAAINDAGEVIGRAETAELMPDDNWRIYQRGYPLQYYFYHAFLYSDGKMQDLGTLGGKVSYATAINASGQIVGQTMTADDHWHYYIYRDGKTTILDGDIFDVTGINDSGQIVGLRSRNASDSKVGFMPIPFTLNDGKKQDLFGDFKGGNNAYGQIAGINNSGMITGVLATGDHENFNLSMDESDRHAFIYHPEGWMEFIGFYPTAINSVGDVIGWGYPPDNKNHQHAYLYHNKQEQDLGALDGYYSFAHAINASGDVVGEFGSPSINKEPDQGRAFLYRDGKMQDLNAIVGPDVLAKAGFKVLTQANGINAKGQIVGVGIDLHDHDIAFLLTPPASANPPPAKTSPAK